MKTFLLLAIGSTCLKTMAWGQTVSAGAATVAIKWQPAANPDKLSLDLDGDTQPDVVFTYTASTTAPPSAQTRTFTVSSAGTSGVELAVDANEYDSAHRYQLGDLVEGAVLWQGGSGYLDYTVTGNGGTGGRGFFRSNAAGLVVLRKKQAGAARYWWFYIGPRLLSTDDWIGYYGTNVVALATTAAATTAAAAAFPNPTTAGWQLSRPAAYQLFDSQGRLVGSSQAPAAAIEALNLPPGLYTVLLRLPEGRAARQTLLKR